jgi:signal transduction histidine kinase
VAQSVRSRIMTQLYGEHTDNPRLQQRLHTLAKAAGAPARANGVTAGDAGTDATASSAPPAECSADAADRSSGWPWTQPPRPPVDPVRHVAEVAHELRNPLNGVIGFTSLLALSDLDQRQRTYAEGAQTSAQMLLRLCNQLLDLSALDAGHFRLSLAAVDARALAQETAAVLQPLADARAGLKLRVDCASDLPGWLELDASRVQQILMNLLGNALKFTLRGEVVVQVGWRPGDAPANEAASTRAAAPGDRGQLCLAVQDTGCGIDNRLLEHLFDEFTQADVHDNRGAGLGLAISRRIAQAMHGSLNACSRPGVGSRFELRVPTVVLTPDAATRNDLAQASPAGTNGPAPQRTQPLSPLSP